ncbi:MAG TPA: VOC family protein [Noviherbaspirillum sp.]
MVKAIYVNLQVSDLARSKAFFEALGFAFNPQFTNEQAAALVISDTIYAMLHTRESILRFTKKELVDARSSTEVLLALQVESREEVDALVTKALEHGGRQAREAADHGFMYERSFEDPDGHVWEAFWMDPAQMAG